MNFLPFFLFLVFVGPRVAEAYIDPGTGSFIIQVAIASLAGVALYVKLFWRRIRAFGGTFLNKGQEDKEETQSTQSNGREQRD